MEQQKVDWEKVNECTIAAWKMPEYRTALAIQREVERNLLFKTWGGIGDQICAEPTLRFAFSKFNGCEISLASEMPELFSHLPFKDVFDLKKHKPHEDRYLTFNTIVSPTTDLTWQFMSHCLINCVDFPSLCALRLQLPVKDREIILKPPTPTSSLENLPAFDKSVYVHAGRHWPSKTFPKDWWDAVITGLLRCGIVPVLIGGDTDDNRGTVDVDTSGCVDMRNKLSISDSIWLLQRCQVLLTNDSAPLHMAASGNAWIGFIATCKHPDYIGHWRHGEWMWQEENLGKGGMWDLVDFCPNKEQEVSVEFVDEAILRTWLPEPMKVVEWTLNKLALRNSPVSI